MGVNPNKMKRILLKFILTIFLFCASLTGQSQVQDVNKLHSYKVAIFSPLYLDSVFDNGNYKYGKKFPKFISPGLDFVQGAMIALDSLSLPDGNIEARIFDSKATVENIEALINSKKLDSFHLIIGAVKDEDLQMLARFSKQKNIPFISATFPNDAGVIENPFMVIVNSTLKTHCEAIYSFLLQSHPTDKIYLVKKTGIQEDRIQEYFKKINAPDGKPLLNIETININEDFGLIKAKLDSNRNTVIIGGSLNETFAFKLTSAMFALNKNYRLTLVGMPNWDGFTSLNKKKAFTDFPVYYTSPYYNSKWNKYSKLIQAVYLKKYKATPTDMSYKGFESVYLFARLLSRYPNDFISHLNDYSFKVFNEYNFKPVFVSKSSLPDYFENKHVYFIKMLNGNFSKAW